MQLHNTLTGRREPFTPARPDRVTMYVCGPTVYGFAHIGNARPAVVFDVLARTLRRHFQGVVYVRNITDIDDKINASAAKEGVPISVIAERYVTAYHEDLAALGVRSPDFEPRVTAHLPHIITMVEQLIAAGHAYAAEGHVLFNVPSFAGYGELSRRDLRERLAGARVEVAPYKRDDGDFVLWKPSDDSQPGWPSPWGRGRPGWHIECSAMAEALLGDTLDIHGGGHDLVFPHHENERAQSECAHQGRPLARFWVHNGFVTIDQAKMAKSVGNVLLVRDLLREAPGEAIRLALLSAHYRQPLDWSSETLPDARRKLDRLYGALRHGAATPTAAVPEGALTRFYAALDDDLNTPAALAELFEIARTLNRGEEQALGLREALREGGAALGLLGGDPEAWFAPTASSDVDGAEIERLVQARTDAKKRKDYAEADRIRKTLTERGITLEDSAQGTRWRVTGTA